MRVRLKLLLDCPPDTAWEAMRSPAVLNTVAGPLLAFRSLEPGGFPARWPEGDHPVEVRALFGLLPAGEQTIAISYATRDGARIVTDDGSATSGPLTAITFWRHRMAIAPHGESRDRTLYRDQLEFEAGALGILFWPALWAFWQWRGLGLRRVARRMPTTAG